jgi:hypothetical protein
VSLLHNGHHTPGPILLLAYLLEEDPPGCGADEASWICLVEEWVPKDTGDIRG